jgi:predicted ATP-grasp superfamily ATP-dependent carboligase/SAM-dependent methyltransferase
VTPVDTSTPVVVLKCMPYPWHSGTIGVIRSLGRLGIPVYLSGESARSPAGCSRYLAGVLHDTPVTDPDELLDRLGSLPLPRPPMLVPVDDVGSIFLDRYGDQLTGKALFPRLPPGLAASLADKQRLAVLAAGSPIPCPETVFVRDRAELTQVAQRWGFPVVVKAADPDLLAKAAAASSVRIAHDPAELDRAAEPLLDPPNLLLQQYLPGASSSVWMVNAYLDRRSEALFAGIGRKLRQLPIETGASTLAVVEPNDEVLKPVLQLLHDLAYQGIVDLGVRADPVRGGYHLLDVNPRIGATFRLFVGDNGMDVARALYLDMTGQPVPASQIPRGRRWLAEHRDPVAGINLVRAQRLTPWAYLRSLRGVSEMAWLDSDDLRPGLALARAATTAILPAKPVRRLVGARPEPPPNRRTPGAEPHPSAVTRYFGDHADEWDVLYRRPDVTAMIYQERSARCLRWVDEQALPYGARVLEVGCGAGRTATALARRGFAVDAVDRSAEMLEVARGRGADDGGTGRVRYIHADAGALPFASGAYDLVIALGVVPWLSAPQTALAEIGRVLAPGGSLIVSADNRYRLSHLFDPRYSPALAGARRRARNLRLVSPLVNRHSPRVAMHAPGEFDSMLRRAGLSIGQRASVGFGPFAFLGLRVLPEPLARRVNARLQKRSDSGHTLLASLGSHYLALARKAETATEPGGLSRASTATA